MSKLLRAGLLGVLVIVGSLGGLAAMAEPSAPPVAEGPQERVLFTPGSELDCSIYCWIASVRDRASVEGCICDAAASDDIDVPQDFGLTAQNVGVRNTKLIATYVRPTAQGGAEIPCDGCSATSMQCSEVLAPGGVARIPTYATVTDTSGSRATGVLAEVYSLSTHLARDYGPGYAAWLAGIGVAPDTSLADAICAQLAPDAGQPDAEKGLVDCPSYRSFKGAYLSGAPYQGAPGLPFAPFRGEPIAGVMYGPRGTLDGRLSMDRYRALPVSEVGLPSASGAAGTHKYFAPGAHFGTSKGFSSTLSIHNVSLGCSSMTLRPYRTGGPVGVEPIPVRLAPGEARSIVLGREWPIGADGAVQIDSDGPVAALLVTRGISTSTSHSAIRAREGEVDWFVPLAYQEGRMRPSAAAADGMIGGLGATLEGAEGWETTVAVLNPSPDLRTLDIEAQASGRRPRNVSVDIGPMEQGVFGLNYGLGRVGGPGWASVRSTGEAMYVAVTSLRRATDSAALQEAWSTTAWPRESGEAVPQIIALPDLGLPQRGDLDGVQVPSETYTPALTTTLAVQNLTARQAEVAIDAYARCGYASTLTRTIEGGESLLVGAEELSPEVRGSNSAMIRVVEGEVAVLVEIAEAEQHTHRSTVYDFTNAYLGTPILGRPGASGAPTATLTVSPTRITARRDDPVFPPITVSSAEGPRRCMVFRATSDALWLTPQPGSGSVPGEFELVVDVEALGTEPRHEATVTVDVHDPAVGNSPAYVHVALVSEILPEPLYMPLAVIHRRVGH